MIFYLYLLFYITNFFSYFNFSGLQLIEATALLFFSYSHFYPLPTFFSPIPFHLTGPGVWCVYYYF